MLRAGERQYQVNSHDVMPPRRASSAMSDSNLANASLEAMSGSHGRTNG